MGTQRKDQPKLGCRKANDQVRPHNVADGNLGRVSLRTRLHVDRDNRTLTSVVEYGNRLGVNTAYWRLEASTQDRVHQQIALEHLLRRVTLQLFLITREYGLK